MSAKRKWLAALPAALILASITTFAVAQVAGTGGVGRLLIYLNGSQKYVDRVNFSGFTGVQDGGLLTLSGGGSASNPTGCVQGSLLSAGSDGGDSTCNGNVVTVDNAGSITTPVGATIGTLDPRTAKTTLDNLPARVISSDEFKSGTQDFDYCFSVNITTTNATATVFYRIATPSASQLFARWTCNATQLDGGGALVSAKYSREAAYTVPDGGSLPAGDVLPVRAGDVADDGRAALVASGVCGGDGCDGEVGQVGSVGLALQDGEDACTVPVGADLVDDVAQRVEGVLSAHRGAPGMASSPRCAVRRLPARARLAHATV
jgi:hypothetical protein